VPVPVRLDFSIGNLDQCLYFAWRGILSLVGEKGSAGLFTGTSRVKLSSLVEWDGYPAFICPGLSIDVARRVMFKWPRSTCRAIYMLLV